MAAISFLQIFLENNCPFMHRSRQKAVIKVTQALLGTSRLTLTSLGRHLPGRCQQKNKIKCVDRLLGNPRLHKEIIGVYRALCHGVLRGRERPVILVDWSDCTPGRKHLMLKAAVAIEGRALTLYEEVHPLKDYNKPAVHMDFLHHLAVILPEECRPIVITDAGFRGPWFEAVRRLGWDFIGRVRNKIHIDPGMKGKWFTLKELYRRATGKVRALGESWLSRKYPYDAHLYLLRKKGHKDPWLLATSLSPEQYPARQVVALYGKRMQIEETFRDLKDARFSLGMTLARTHSLARQQVLLLLGALAMLALWLVGLAARAKGWHRAFQANTVRTKHVLSVIFLGREVWKERQYYRLSPGDLWEAAETLVNSIVDAAIPHNICGDH